MSLNWNLTKIDNFETVCRESDDSIIGPDGGPLQRMRADTEAIIFYMMHTDLGWELTKENVDEFAARIWMHAAMFGSILRNSDGSDAFIPYERLVEHIGLGVNVAPAKRRTWLRSKLEFFEREADLRVSKAKRELRAAETATETAQI